MAYSPTTTHQERSLSQGGFLSPGQRSAYVLGGLALAAMGMKPRPNMLLNLLTLGAGAYLAYRGSTGYCPVKALIKG
ncbi:MAG TPA: hypothetical protein VHL31_17955 [Geminicoccus sp.]|jgi:uncharacterized membrane protein|uniref:hypothetical protein n=1 Tax=Geminicoccus sp. TaxID=2024832 RepID=UPI002E3042D2|nr:hypothetical protein [Geminicoccus sp.]HEX2528172.1 hypothetical protein [Geminicoccus sp.]